MDSKVNVLYVSPNGFLGGAEAFVLEVSSAHSGDGPFKITNLFFNPGECVEKSRENGIETILLPERFKLSRPFKLLKAILYCRKLLKEKDIHIIHSTMPYAHIVMSLSALFLPIRHVWFQHGPIDGILDKVGNWFPVDCLMFNSRFLVEEHHKLMGLKPRWGEKIIPLGIKPKIVTSPEVSDLKELVSSTESPIIIGAAGRINRFKGYHIFINAITKLREDLTSEDWSRCFFPIIGGANSDTDKEYLSELKTQVKELNLLNKVHFLGHKSNINDYLSKMDFFLHCSPDEEAISIVAAEAMLQNTVVIGSGIGDIVHDNKTGFECDTSLEHPQVHLAQVLKDKIEAYAKDSHTFDPIKKAADELIRSHYSKENMIKEVESVYSALN